MAPVTEQAIPDEQILTRVRPEDVPALAAGAAIFGTGGGGAVHTAQQIVQRALVEHGPVELVGVDDLTADDAVIMMSGVGAPTVGIEMLSSTAQAETLLAEAQRALGRRITTIMPAEIGGSNGVSPIGWAARLGVKVLDADGMGRAFPEATMISPNVAGVPCEFAVQADVVGNVDVRRTIDLTWLERHARAGVVASGGIVIAAHYPLTAETVRGAVIPRTISRAIRAGHALLSSSEPVPAIADELGAETLITGKIVDVARRTEGGFVRGSVTVAGTGENRGRLQRIELQNENLVALEDGNVLASVPDLISILDSETGHAISTEMIRFGQRVAVIAWPCDPLWRTPRGLELAGPTAFGYDLPYVPFERKSPR
ncbi:MULTISPECIES: DUF917 domain-containing protein [unclassified Microbacterium]|uniref:DUF917 domain-containing protein n=1 Tax=unclassified Microbacterium TaxID=2609290 RepID=UPI00097E7719|nr:DUF917 domain-containing protein [Microbacterium sp. JB110]RCS57238.1 DUF917 domain-containing protein [Microbacterium sp. JB110]SJM59099.1 Conservative hypothetical protein probably involved in hydantoin, pyrimidine utilization [Frigoribacterium sp. JB110]